MKIKQLNQHLAYTETALKPQFHDLDPLDIVWHGNYVKYLETARCELLKSIGYDYPEMKESGFAWPVVDMRLKYIRPARYGIELIIACAVTEWENRLKINYEIRERASGVLIHRAYTIQVAVNLESYQMCYQSPEVLGRALKTIRV
ncbi:acyl-CoA thioesterase [Hydromonas duriensis]|uniref:Acyl-CoA thioester hydrolase n=1 Tax=Hydromonas duriensis TaxID=1527608 RepID=A0A4R6Y2L7_9BURK|nr:acyl-CoA thioesterase [Hydromonas duriensis]TDR30753.1 acyl-CoA thioester hydrolase [Hydromonas duriensis]